MHVPSISAADLRLAVLLRSFAVPGETVELSDEAIMAAASIGSKRMLLYRLDRLVRLGALERSRLASGRKRPSNALRRITLTPSPLWAYVEAVA